MLKLKNGFYTNVLRNRNMLYYRGYDENGKQIFEKIKYKPTVYLKSKRTDTKFKSPDGLALEPLQFESMSALREFQQTYKGVKDYEIWGNTRHIPALIQHLFPKEIDFKRETIDIGNIDIETSFYTDLGDRKFPDSENPLNAIYTLSYKSSKSNTYHAFGIKNYKLKDSRIPDLNVEYHEYNTEKQMLMAFVEFFASEYPDIITGWNSNAFDVPYIVGRISHVCGENIAKKLSPWGIINKRETFIKGSRIVFFELEGISSIDYMDLFKKFCLLTYGQQESYALDHVASVVLGEKKIDYSEVENLEELYRTDFQKYMTYNIKDVELIQRFEDKLGLLNLVTMMAYKTGVNFSDCLGTTAMWDSLIFRHLARKNICIPQPGENNSNDDRKVPGGFVSEPVPGKYKWIMCFDLSSLYPSVARQYNLSFDTKTKIKIPGVNQDTIVNFMNGEHDYEILDDVTFPANGVCYRRDKQGIFPELLDGLYEERIEIKNQQMDSEAEYEKTKDKRFEKIIANCETSQLAIKTLMNSGYGAFCNKYFRYYDYDLASAITMTGQAIVKYSARIIDETVSNFLGLKNIEQFSIYTDTDSCYLNAEKVIEKYKPKDPVKFLNEFAKKVVDPALAKGYNKFSEKTNAFDRTLKMDMELICDSAIWVAGKNYILSVLVKDKTCYDKPQIKMKGIAAVKSSTTQFCREKLKESFKVILNKSETETQQFIKDVKKEFIKLSPHEIAFPRSVSNVKKYTKKDWFIKGTPINSRAAIVHNWFIDELDMANEVKKIDNGDKMKFIHLKAPNPVKNQNIIGFSRYMPKQFKLEKYVDKNLMFQKTFVDAIKHILDAIGWDVEKKASLNSFFG